MARCKLCNLIVEHDLSAPGGDGESLNEYLISRWLGEGVHESIGYKPLTQWFNQYHLKEQLERNGERAPQYRVTTLLETIQSTDEIEVQEAKRELDDAGIDADQLQDDFISWSTMRRHLNNCLEAEKKPQQPKNGTDWKSQVVDKGKSVLRDSINQPLKNWEKSGDIVGATDADVSVQILLECPASGCSNQVTLETALERGVICPDHFEADDSEGKHNTAHTSIN